MYTKVKIFNLALGALLLTRQIADADADASSEARVLNLHYETALKSTLQDMDLDSTSTQANLELLYNNPNDLWLYAYKYPSKCAFFRRIQNCELKDTPSNQIKKRIGMFNGKKVIFTNQQSAIGEYIDHDVPLVSLSANAGLAIAYKLAILAAPLISGKGARLLREDIKDMYVLAKMEAQEQDHLENSNFETPWEQSEFVRARTT